MGKAGKISSEQLEHLLTSDADGDHIAGQRAALAKLLEQCCDRNQVAEGVKATY